MRDVSCGHDDPGGRGNDGYTDPLLISRLSWSAAERGDGEGRDRVFSSAY